MLKLGQLESKVNMHMNSADGINDGIYKILFDDGVEVCYLTCPG
jgi:hypothetical protein